MEALLAEANLHPDTHQEEERPLAQAFDEDVGGIAAAIRSKVLPARYFAGTPQRRQRRRRRRLRG